MGYGVFPKMGVVGSAIATVISRAIGLIYLIVHITIGHSTIQFKYRYLRPNIVLLKRVVSIGSFASLQVLIREISFLFLMRLVASFGAITIAGYGIGSRLRMCVMVPGFGFATASGVLVGQNMGANQPDRAIKSAWQTLLYYELIAISISIIFIIFATQIVGFFNDYPEVIKVGASFLRYLAITFPFLACSLIFSQSMNGAGATKIPTIINAIGQLGFRIPLAYLFAITTELGTSGIWLGINASDIIQGILMMLIFHLGYWKKIYLKHKEALEIMPSELR